MNYYYAHQRRVKDTNHAHEINCICADKEFDLNVFIHGERYNKEWNDDFRFYYDIKKDYKFFDYLNNDMSWFLVSEKLKNLIIEMNTEVEFFPVYICDINNSVEPKRYYAANIVTTVDALCLEISDYGIIEYRTLGPTPVVTKYGIYESKTEGKDLFKLVRPQEIPIFCSEKIKSAVEKNKITGFYFYPLRVK